jgi:hypothetical protein
LDVFQVKMSLDVKIRLTIFDKTLKGFLVKMSLDVKIRLTIFDKTLKGFLVKMSIDATFQLGHGQQGRRETRYLSRSPFSFHSVFFLLLFSHKIFYFFFVCWFCSLFSTFVPYFYFDQSSLSFQYISYVQSIIQLSFTIYFSLKFLLLFFSWFCSLFSTFVQFFYFFYSVFFTSPQSFSL